MQLRVKKIYRLTEGQWELLMNIHENEILNLPPVTVLETMYAKKLLTNGLINVIPTHKDGKTLLVYSITQLGKQVLHQQLP